MAFAGKEWLKKGIIDISTQYGASVMSALHNLTKMSG